MIGKQAHRGKGGQEGIKWVGGGWKRRIREVEEEGKRGGMKR